MIKRTNIQGCPKWSHYILYHTGVVYRLFIQASLYTASGVRTPIILIAENSSLMVFKSVTVNSISQIALELGFKYPQHFSRMFRKSTGYTPRDYRLMN